MALFVRNGGSRHTGQAAPPQRNIQGAPINSILHGKKNNTAFMRLVKYLNFMMPYFVEYYDLEVVA